MANVNKVILIGNLTRDPQLSYTPNQTPVVELGLAVNRRWRGQDGSDSEETCFVDLQAYGRQAETLNKYVRKGNPLYVEGRLKLNQWEAQDGTKRSKLRVIIEGFQFLGRANDGGGGAGGGSRNEFDSRQAATVSPSAEEEPPSPPPTDDVPF